MSKSELANFAERSRAERSLLYLPTDALSTEYGVNDEEESEYAALEIARAAAEAIKAPFIVALELESGLFDRGTEVTSGVIEGNFEITYEDVIALYLIVDPEEELEWYDASEFALCITQVGQ